MTASNDPTAVSEVPPRPTNRLAGQTSPYLLQHAGNPVAWQPWAPEAFELARRQDKPVFLSVGYSTCYWCHVMERESFESEAVAAVLNEHFVSIKVDREERPDVDQQYMLVSQWITGRGGWPNSVWLTPQGKPWMAGTYFPREQFIDLLRALAEAWRTRRREVNEQAERLAESVREAAKAELPPPVDRPLDQSWIDRAVGAMRRSFDPQDGGFGRAPKFPPHDRLALLAHEASHGASAEARTMFTATLDAMAAGGIHDHVGGGFHRYSTDGRWLVPHFEKMLYDNALLLRAYAEAFRLTQSAAYRDVADGIVAWLTREMLDEAGGFHSALDAETEREEGKFYVWTHREIVDALGPADGPWFAAIYGVTPQGNYVEHPSGRRTGANVLHLPRNTRVPADAASIDRLAACRRKLLEVRNTRPRPHLDDKVLASWNGLMIGALTHAAGPLGRSPWLELAVRAAEFVLNHMTTADGELLHTYRAGQARLPGYLDDYAYMAAAMLDLHAATGEARWLDAARRLADAMCREFFDRAGSGFFFTSAAHEDLLARSKNLVDGGNTPSPNAVALQTLLRLSDLERPSDPKRPSGSGVPLLAGKQCAPLEDTACEQAVAHDSDLAPAGNAASHDYRAIAASTLTALSGLLWQYPEGTESLLLAAAMSLRTERAGGDDSASSDDRATSPQLSVELFASHRSVSRGQTFHLAVVFAVEAGWHLYGPRSDPTRVLPIRVAVQPSASLEPAAAVAPPGEQSFDARLQCTMEVYRGRVAFLIPIRVAGGAAAGPADLAVDVSAAACGERECLPPLRATLATSIAIQAEPAAKPLRHRALFASLGVQS